MRHLLALFIVMFAATGAGFANEATGWSAESLSWWVGKYPTTTVNKKTVSVLETKFLKAAIDAAVPASERKLLNTFDVETPITMVGNFMVIQKCKPHDCPSEYAMVVIDVEKQRLWAGFFTRAANRTATRWYGNKDDYSVLPPAIKQEFLARHGD